MDLAEAIAILIAVVALGVAAHTQGKLDQLLKVLEEDDDTY